MFCFPPEAPFKFRAFDDPVRDVLGVVRVDTKQNESITMRVATVRKYFKLLSTRISHKQSEALDKLRTQIMVATPG